MAADVSTRRVVAVGASAGGVQALTALASGLPADFAVPIVVVLHVPSGAHSALAGILDRAGPLPAQPAVSSTHMDPGSIYVATPDRHLVVRDSQLFLTDGPTENGHRPAINALFRSTAIAAGPGCVGVLLSGVLDDGVAGLAAIRSCSGVTVAQEPTDAVYPQMPTNAIEAAVVDHVVPMSEMGALLSKLSTRDVEERPMNTDPKLELENRIAMGARFSARFEPEAIGPPAGFSCPDCNGTLLDVGNSTYRCRVGHAWTPEALLKAQGTEIENALWVALRALDEKAKLSTTLADRSTHPESMLRTRYTAVAGEVRRAAEVLRKHLAELYESEPEGSR